MNWAIGERIIFEEYDPLHYGKNYFFNGVDASIYWLTAQRMALWVVRKITYEDFKKQMS